MIHSLKFFATFFIFLMATSTEQQPKGINITIEKGHKKITYFAENVTDHDLDLFFKVKSTGFRRSSNRPLIETIPAKTKKALLTLIPLKDQDTTHSYLAILTKKEHNIDLRKTDTLNKNIRSIDPTKER